MKAPDMGKMIGPLPLGAWAAVLAGGLGVALYTRQQGGGGSGAPAASEDYMTDDTGGVPGVGTGAVSSWIQTGPPAGGPASSVSGPPTDNDEWSREAINYLIAQGYSATVSDSAIRKYTSLDRLSAQEFALVAVSLRHLGSPPTPLPPPIFAPPTMPMSTPIIPRPRPPVIRPPAARPPTKLPTRAPAKPKVVVKPPLRPPIKPPAKKPHAQPHVRYYTVVRGDSLWRIATQFYRHGMEWPRIYNANRYGKRRADNTPGVIHNANTLTPGMKLIIP